MIFVNCTKYGSSKIKKNGHTLKGQQKYYCHNCGFYGTLDIKEPERKAKHKLVDELHLKRLLQRAIARITGVDRKAIRSILKKALTRDNHNNKYF